MPNGCIYRSMVLGREDQVSKVSFDIILSKKIFRKIVKIFTAKSEGKMDQKNGFQSFHVLGRKIDLKCMGVL